MKRGGLIILLIMLMWGCENTTFVSSVPYYPVRLELNILAEYPNFVAAGGIQVLEFTSPRYPTESLGYAGIMVYTAFDNRYHACDMCCPNCLKRSEPVHWDNGFYAHCPTCGEDYDISYGYGTPTKGIAKEQLRPYKTAYNNGKLSIY